MCHTHILSTIHGKLEHCSPMCDYLSVSVAYNNIGDRRKAFDFCKLAYKHQLYCLDDLEKAKLILNLYSDYSDESLGNDMTKASRFLVMITNDVYPILISTSSYDLGNVLCCY